MKDAVGLLVCLAATFQQRDAVNAALLSPRAPGNVANNNTHPNSNQRRMQQASKVSIARMRIEIMLDKEGKEEPPPTRSPSWSPTSTITTPSGGNHTQSPTPAPSTDQNRRPNFIFILAEDMAFGDLGCYGHPYARTPNLDKLAAEGTRFLRFYVPGVTCNPSRVGLMTSRHPGSFPNYMADFGLQGAKTITEMLNDAGYATGHVGKWHLGPDDDNGTYGIDDIRITGRSRDATAGRDALVYDEAIDFIEQHKEEPFYLNVWQHVAHSPVAPDKYLVDRFCDVSVDRDMFGDYTDANKFGYSESLGGNVDEGMQNYLADLWGMDVNIGRLVKKLKDLSLDDNTVLIFTTDHGAAKVNPDGQSHPFNMMGVGGGLRGGKHDFWEGGIRVPFIVWYPGHVPAGKVNHETVLSGLDLLPTVASIAKISYDADMFEGEDMMDVFLGEVRLRSNPLYWTLSRAGGYSVILWGRWKLLFNNRKAAEKQLYDLEKDRAENNNLYGNETYANIQQVLEENLAAWKETLPEKVCWLDDKDGNCDSWPNPNPYDLSQPPTKIPPPKDIAFEVVSCESAGNIPDTSANFTPSPICAAYPEMGESQPAFREFCPIDMPRRKESSLDSPSRDLQEEQIRSAWLKRTVKTILLNGIDSAQCFQHKVRRAILRRWNIEDIENGSKRHVVVTFMAKAKFIGEPPMPSDRAQLLRCASEPFVSMALVNSLIESELFSSATSVVVTMDNILLHEWVRVEPNNSTAVPASELTEAPTAKMTEEFQLKEGANFITCEWLKKKKHEKKLAKRCKRLTVGGKRVREFCPEICGN